MANIYSLRNEADVALAAATAKSILGVRSGAAFGIALKSWGVSFDGVSATAEPVAVHLCHATFATNAPGTASTDASANIAQTSGKTLAHGCTAAHTWTTEPTVLVEIDEILLTPNGGTYKWAFPLGDEPDGGLSEGYVIRCNAPAVVNVRGSFTWIRV